MQERRFQREFDAQQARQAAGEALEIAPLDAANAAVAGVALDLPGA